VIPFRAMAWCIRRTFLEVSCENGFEDARAIKTMLKLSLAIQQELHSSVVPQLWDSIGFVPAAKFDFIGSKTQVESVMDPIQIRIMAVAYIWMCMLRLAFHRDAKPATSRQLAIEDGHCGMAHDAGLPSRESPWSDSIIWMCMFSISVWRIAKKATSRQAELEEASHDCAHDVRPLGLSGPWCFLPLEPEDLERLSRAIRNDAQAWDRFEKFVRRAEKGKHSEIQWKPFYVIVQGCEHLTFDFRMELMWSGPLYKPLTDA